jgi:hypothetical protein
MVALGFDHVVEALHCFLCFGLIGEQIELAIERFLDMRLDGLHIAEVIGDGLLILFRRSTCCHENVSS